MSTSTKLIILLTVLVGSVMIVGGYYRLQQRHALLVSALQNELHAHALTLRIALSDHYRDGRHDDAQQLINKLSENPKILGVVLFDANGNVAMLSNQLVAEEISRPLQVKEVINANNPVFASHRIAGQEVTSILMPFQMSDTERGAFEIAQPRSFVEADFMRARRDITLVTISLFLVITLGVLLVLGRNLARPIRELLTGAEALGEGDLNYRVIVPAGNNEFSRLASAFNRMADRLSQQRLLAENTAAENLKLEQKLLTAERLASVGRLAAGVAHEMGAPLNVIKGRTERLMEQLAPLSEKTERNLTIINHQADVIARIVRQLLDLGRPLNLNRQAISITELIASTIELVEEDARTHHIRIDHRSGADLLVNGDPGWLKQVLLNICRNAIQSMPQGGTLQIETSNMLVMEDGGTYMSVRISDTGTGIPASSLHQIFDPFFTTKDVGQGIGLGLSISRRIVEEHDGWIEVENNALGGATFTIWLPNAEAPNQTLAQKQERHEYSNSYR